MKTIRFKYFNSSSVYSVYCKSWQDFFNKVLKEYILVHNYIQKDFKPNSYRFKKVGGVKGITIEYVVTGKLKLWDRRVKLAKIEVSKSYLSRYRKPPVL